MNDAEYLSVKKALEIVLEEANVLSSVFVPTLESLDRVLAEDITARHDLPIFPNSSMDGYALRSSDTRGATKENPKSLRVIADLAAGTESKVIIGQGSAARITTGAPLPEGADAVIPVEKTSEPWRDSSRKLPPNIEIYQSVSAGDYVRWPGEDVTAGTVVLQAGAVIRPQEIGLLASLGYDRLPVHRRPRIGILATGDELVDIDAPLAPGKIRNSNSYALAAQVFKANGVPIMLGVATDTEESVQERLHAGIELGVDLFVSSAGVSVGAYDVVKAVIESKGTLRFWRVRMRPGKPVTFGIYEGRPYLGLPGNPVSAVVSFERFARPAIMKMAGSTQLERPTIKVTMLEKLQSDGRESYIRAVVSRENGDYTATTTGGQGSHMLSSLVRANALVIVPEGIKAVAAGDVLEAMMIDWPTNVF